MCKRSINRLPLACAPTRDWAHNPGMCPAPEVNLLLCRMTSNQLSHAGQGRLWIFGGGRVNYCACHTNLYTDIGVKLEPIRQLG